MTLRVNGEEIPESAILFEFNRLVKFYSEHMSAEQIKQQMDALRHKAKDQAIGAKLLMKEAERLDIRVPPDDVDQRLGKMVRNAGGAEAFERILQSQNLTKAMVRDSIEKGRKVDLLIDRITADVPDPTEAEMQAHFEQHAKEYTKPERAQARHILVKPHSAGTGDKQTAKAKLLEIRMQIDDGADFADLAAAHSECPSGKKAGGSLGWFSRGMMVPELDEAVFSMEIGELSDIIETSLGFHLVAKTAQDEGGETTFVEVQDKVREFLRHGRRGAVISGHVDELKQKAMIEED